MLPLTWSTVTGREEICLMRKTANESLAEVRGADPKTEEVKQGRRR